jgi:hypothetical protein
MDIDGDGLFFTMPNPASSDAYWIPEKPINRYNANTYDKAVKEIKRKLMAENLANDPNPSEWKQAIWNIKGILATSGNEILKNIRAKKTEKWGWDPWNVFMGGLMETIGNNKDMIVQEVQKNQQEIVLLESIMADKGDVRNYNILKGNLVMSKDGRVIKSDNAFFDLIANNEGFEGNIYDAQKLYMQPKKHARLMGQAYTLWKEQPDKYSTQWDAFKSLTNKTLMANMDKYGMYDPTIGHGFSINNKDAMNAILSIQNDDGSSKYTMKGLLNGDEFLKMEDSIKVFLDTVLPEKQNFVKSLYPDIDFTDAKNSYLFLPLVDMAYVAGNAWIGHKRNGEPTEFYKHLNNLMATKDFGKYLGVWGTEDTDTILGQMTLDANARKKDGLTGLYHRLEQNAFYFKKWSEGSKIWVQEDDPDRDEIF